MNHILLSELKEIYSNKETALFDLGDGICCIGFKSKGNSISPYVSEFITETINKYSNNFQGIVIGNQSKNFSVGADLFSMKTSIDNKDFDFFNKKIRIFQSMTSLIKYCNKPVVAAPYKMTLGGGLEVALHSHARVALDKSYMGLVEVGVGLLPGGGGTKECALRIAQGNLSEEEIYATFDKLIFRTVSKNYDNAKQLGYLQEEDVMIENQEDLINEAKQKCLTLISNGFQQRKELCVTLPGKELFIRLKNHAELLLEENKISKYDYEIGKVIAKVLAGSDKESNVTVTEADILKLEREAFVSLIKQNETYERISHFVETGELLRN